MNAAESDGFGWLKADLRGATAMSDDFWHKLDDLVGACALVIDRPSGSAHPRYPNLLYPLDYGYLAGTTAADGDGIDVWIGSLPERRVTGIIATVDLLKRDVEIKVLLGCTAEEARLALAMHQTGSQAAVLLRRRV
jgi:inorganic pyrophosphatase